MKEQSFVLPTERLVRGNPRAAIATAPHRLRAACASAGRTTSISKGDRVRGAAGRRRHADLQLHAASGRSAAPWSRTRSTCRRNDVVVECRRMGGGFGGKESQLSLFACVAALLARKTGKPAKLRVDRDDDMLLTGKRHDFVYRVRSRVRRARAHPRSSTSSLAGALRLFGRPVRVRSTTARCSIATTATTSTTSASCRSAARPTPCRTRRSAASAARRACSDRAGDRRHRARISASIRSTCARPTSTAPRSQRHALQADDRGQRAPRDRRRAREERRLRAPARGDPRVERTNPGAQARHRAHAGEVRHFVHRDASEPGRRLLHVYTRRHAPAEPWRHRDGSGSVHQSGAGGRGGVAGDVDRIRITASDTSKVPNASPTAASSGCDINGKAAQAAARSSSDGCRSSRRSTSIAAPETSSFAPTAGARGRALAFFRRTGEAGVLRARVSCRPPASIATPKIQLRSQDLERHALLLLLLRRRGLGSRHRHADGRESPAARSTSCTTSAGRSIPRSTWGRSKAASSRAWAG